MNARRPGTPSYEVALLAASCLACLLACEPSETTQPPAEADPWDQVVGPSQGDASADGQLALVDHSSEMGRVRASFPVKPVESEGSGTPEIRAQAQGALFSIGWMDAPERIPKSDVAAALDGARDGLLERDGSELATERSLDWAGYPARELELFSPVGAEGAAMRFRTRLVLVDRRLYVVVVGGDWVRHADRLFASVVFSN